jgi:uncharacterized membrane protein YeaQ/YmgE (transglycosylase-associated protein family)
MGLESVLAIVIVGAVSGWLAGRIVSGYGFGLLGNIAVGIAGAFVATLVLPALGIGAGGGFGRAILHSTLGAVLLLVLIRVVRRA